MRRRRLLNFRTITNYYKLLQTITNYYNYYKMTRSQNISNFWFRTYDILYFLTFCLLLIYLTLLPIHSQNPDNFNLLWREKKQLCIGIDVHIQFSSKRSRSITNFSNKHPFQGDGRLLEEGAYYVNTITRGSYKA